jgi:type II secretory ATPase GspE/PulE/Tfp pilus assembly ATPase PilB-like protein
MAVKKYNHSQKSLNKKQEAELIEDSVNEIIKQAVKRGASDIHLEPRQDILLIRFRIDGRLREANRLPKIFETLLIEHVKQLAGLKQREHHLPQEGSFSQDFINKTLVFKVSCIPTVDGEKIVIKVFNEEGNFSNLKELGLWGNKLKLIDGLLLKNSGLALFSGPASSGKSTIINILLNKLSTPSINISSIEEVVETRIKGVNQIQLGASINLSYANSLRSLMDQDANVIYVEEIRDLDTLDIAIEAASSGKLLMSSLNGNSTKETLVKLLNLGVKPLALSTELNLLSCQKLVRRLCLKCRIEYKPDIIFTENVFKKLGISFSNIARIHELENIAIKEGLGPDLKDSSSDKKSIKKLYKANIDGCNECNFSGYKGRIGLFEVINFDNKNKEFLAKNELNKLTSEIDCLIVDGLVKALRGLTSIEEILQVI